MAVFSFNTFNHCPQGKIIVEDITRIMGHQMIALGHDVHFGGEGFIHASAGLNVVLEAFDDPSHVEQIAVAHSRGCRFLFVATEEPTKSGFNHGLEPAMIDRQIAFQHTAQFADGILHLVPGKEVTAWYSQFAPSAHAELGFSSTLVNESEDIEPEVSFGFFGKMTWRREQMLARLEELSGSKVGRITSLDVPRVTRDMVMRQAKVIVQIRANEEWGAVSSTRCASALLFGRPVIAEPHPSPAPWDRIVHFSNSVDEFYSDAVAAAKGWRDLHRFQLELFKTALPPEVCVGRPLREIGITKGAEQCAS